MDTIAVSMKLFAYSSICTPVAIAGSIFLCACGGGGSGTAAPAAAPRVPYSVSTFAGGTKAVAGDPSAPYIEPRDVATDAVGNTYATSGCAIIKFTPAAVATTFAGGDNCALLDGAGTVARFTFPSNLAVDNAGNVFVVDGRKLRKVTPAGVVTTVSGLLDAAGADVPPFLIRGIAADSAGMLYASSEHAILKITPSGLVTRLAGNGTAGNADGAGEAARFDSPQGVAVDAAGNVYVADQNNGRIRKLSPQGHVSTLAGGQISGPVGVAVDRAGTVYATGGRTFMHKVTGISYFGGEVYVMNGAGAGTKIGVGAGYVDGPPTVAQFNRLDRIAVDGAGNVLVGDSSAIRKITP